MDSSKGYIEGNLQWVERKINQVKISGLYPGSLKEIVDYIDTLDEKELFLLLKEVRESKRDFLPRIVASNNSLKEIENYKEICSAEEYLIYQTRKFGVDIPDGEVHFR